MKYIKFLLVFAISCPQLHAETFSYTFKCPEKFDSICLHGHFTEGKEFTLFAEKDGSTCKGVTATNLKYSDEAVTFKATSLKKLKGCQGFDKYFLALEGPAKGNFKHLSIYDVKDKKVSEKIKSESNKMDLPYLSLKTSKQYVKYKKSNFSSSPPSIQRITGFPENIFLLEYAMTFTKRGPVYIWSNGKFQAVSDVCSQSPSAFMIGSDLYFMAGPRCCECGWYSKDIYKYENGIFKKVYSNGDWST